MVSYTRFSITSFLILYISLGIKSAEHHALLKYHKNIGLSLPSFNIPCIFISILYWSLSFWLTSLCVIGSSFIRVIRTDSNEFFLMAEHGVYVPQLPYPFIC